MGEQDLTILDHSRRLAEENEKLQQELEEMGTKNVDLVLRLKDIEQQLEEARNGPRQDLAELNSRVERAESRAQQLQTELDKCLAEREQARRQLEERIEARGQESTAEIEQSRKRVAELEERLADRAQAVNQLRDSSQAELAERSAKVARLTAELEQARLRILELEGILEARPEPESGAEVDSESVTSLETEVEPEPEETLRPAARATGEVQRGVEMLGAQDFDGALELFEQLHRSEPDSLPVCLGLFHALAGSRQPERAHQVGRRLIGSLDGEQAEDFAEAFTGVINQLMLDTRGAGHKKQLLLEAAEANLRVDDKQALGFLRQAEILPDRIPREGLIAFYLTRLLENTLEDRSVYLRAYMRELTDRPELLTDIRLIYNHPNYRQALPVARVLMVMSQGSRTQVEEAQRQAGDILTPHPPAGGMIKRCLGPTEASVVKFCLDRLLPEAGIQPTREGPEFKRRWAASEPAPDSSPVIRELVAAANFFGLEEVQLNRGSDAQPFFVDAAGGDIPRVVFDAELERLSSSEARFLIYRKLLQLSRRHLELIRSAGALDRATRERLARKYYDMFEQAGASIPDDVKQSMEHLPEDQAAFNRSLAELLGRLQEATGADVFLDVREFCFAPAPFRTSLTLGADRFAAQVAGLAAACYGIARSSLGDQALFTRIEEQGFSILYDQKCPSHHQALWRIQNLWADRLETAQPD